MKTISRLVCDVESERPSDSYFPYEISFSIKLRRTQFTEQNWTKWINLKFLINIYELINGQRCGAISTTHESSATRQEKPFRVLSEWHFCDVHLNLSGKLTECWLDNCCQFISGNIIRYPTQPIYLCSANEKTDIRANTLNASVFWPNGILNAMWQINASYLVLVLCTERIWLVLMTFTI